MVDEPRIWKSGIAFGFEPADRFSICMKEGSIVARLWSTFWLPTRISSSPFTVVTAPVNVFALRVKAPVTTTSSRLSDEGVRLISYVVRSSRVMVRSS